MSTRTTSSSKADGYLSYVARARRPAVAPHDAVATGIRLEHFQRGWSSPPPRLLASQLPAPRSKSWAQAWLEKLMAVGSWVSACVKTCWMNWRGPNAPRPTPLAQSSPPCPTTPPHAPEAAVTRSSRPRSTSSPLLGTSETASNARLRLRVCAAASIGASTANVGVCGAPRPAAPTPQTALSPPQLAPVALLTARLQADIDMLHRISAWDKACDVADGRPCALAYVPYQAGEEPAQMRARAHQSQVILAASLQSYRRLPADQRDAPIKQLSFIVARHAACLELCYAMLAWPDEAQAITWRILYPTVAWQDYEDDIAAATQDRRRGEGDLAAIQALYGRAPSRYEPALELQPETLRAYYQTEAARLAARLVDVYGKTAEAGRSDAALGRGSETGAQQLAPQAGGAGSIGVWLQSALGPDSRQAWRPHFELAYITIGAFEGEPESVRPPGDDEIAPLEARRARLNQRDTDEQNEAEDFAEQIFGDALKPSARLVNAPQRRTPAEGTNLQAFVVAHLQALLLGARDPDAQLRSERACVREENQHAVQRLRNHKMAKMLRACDESCAMLDDCRRRCQAIERDLLRPNTSRVHARYQQQLETLRVWGDQEAERYERLVQDWLTVRRR